MIVLLHLVVAGICGLECVLALANPRGKLPKLVMFAGLGTIHGVVPALTPAGMMWPDASRGSILTAGLLSVIGVVVFSFGWRIYERLHPQWRGLSPGLEAVVESSDGQRLLRRLFWACGVVGVSAWLLSMIASAGSISAAFEAGRFQYRGEGYKYWRVVLMHLASLVLVPGFVGFFLPGRYRWGGIGFALTMAVLVFLGSQGARAVALGLLGSLMVGYGLRFALSPRRTVVIGLAGAAILVLAVGLYEVRKTMARSTLGEMVQMLVAAETYEGALTSDPLNYHQFLVAAVEHFPRDHPYLNGATYRRLLVFFLRREDVPWLKPRDTHNVFAEAIGGYFSATTIPPTMMGDGYINFWGPPGVVLVMFVNGLVFGWGAQKLRESPLLFIVLGASLVRFALLAIRGSPYEILALVLSSCVFVWLLSLGCGFSYWRGSRTVKELNRSVAFTVASAQPAGAPGAATQGAG